MAVFDPIDAPCGIFAPLAGQGTQQTVEFFRSRSSQNSAGDVLLSFASIGVFSLDVQPLPSQILRQIGGVVVELSHRAIGMGRLPINELDRCYLDGWQLEVVQAAHYGSEHTELDFRHVGR